MVADIAAADKFVPGSLEWTVDTAKNQEPEARTAVETRLQVELEASLQNPPAVAAIRCLAEQTVGQIQELLIVVASAQLVDSRLRNLHWQPMDQKRGKISWACAQNIVHPRTQYRHTLRRHHTCTSACG